MTFYCLFSQTIGFSDFHRPSDGPSAIIPTHSCLTVIARFCGRVRIFVRSVGFVAWMDDQKVVCIVCIKNRLCTLCGNTTPKKTAYNAYKKTVWLRSKAERTKMYALKDAYKVHTECIQAHKE